MLEVVETLCVSTYIDIDISLCSVTLFVVGKEVCEEAPVQ